MFSMCSELTPRALIPDTRIPQFMQPWPAVGWLWSSDDDDDDESNTRRFGYWLKCEAQFVKYLNGVTLQSQQETHRSERGSGNLFLKG